MADIIQHPNQFSREETFEFPCGTMVTIKVPDDEPPLTVQKLIFLMASIQHQTLRMMEAN